MSRQTTTYSNNDTDVKKTVSRRKAISSIVVGGGAITLTQLPSKWKKPIVDSIILPAHAQTSIIAETVDETIVGIVNEAFDTPGTFTFTVPAGVTTLQVTAAGGGGGGGGGGTLGAIGVSGGEGELVTGTITVTPDIACASSYSNIIVVCISIPVL